MIQRKAHNRHAPVPTNDDYIRDVPKKQYTVKHVEQAELRLSPYWMDMYNHTMRRFYT